MHNTRELRCRPQPGELPEIITRSQVWPTGSPPPPTAPISASSPMATLDELPLPVRIGATRTGGIDLNKPRIRAALAGTLALAAAPRLHRRRSHRQGALHERAGRLHQPASRLRSSQAPRQGTRGQACQDTPLSHPARRSPDHRRSARIARPRPRAGARRTRRGRKPAHWTVTGQDYETLRIGMQTLLHDLGIATPAAAAA